MRFESEGDQVLFLAVEHVITDALGALLVQVFVAQDIQLQKRELFGILATASVF